MLPKPDYDQALKRLLVRAHDGFLALIAPGLVWRGELSPELPAAARRADLVWEVELPGGWTGILHIELQTKPDATIGERVAEYGMRLWLREHQPVRSLVIFLRPAEVVPQSPFVIPWNDQESLRYSFDVIRIWEIPPERVLETPYYDLWPLAGLMAGVTANSAIATVERIAAAPLPRQDRSELAGVLILLAGLRVPRAALAEALRRAHMIEDIWKESSFAEAVYDVALEEGREEGMREGRLEGMRQLARTALEGRFGALTDDVLAALNAADEAALTAIVAHITVESLEQVRARLGLS